MGFSSGYDKKGSEEYKYKEEDEIQEYRDEESSKENEGEYVYDEKFYEREKNETEEIRRELEEKQRERRKKFFKWVLVLGALALAFFLSKEVTVRTKFKETLVFNWSEENYKIREVLYSPDNRHIALIGEKNDKQFVVLDGRRWKIFDRVISESLVFSPDSKHLACVAEKNGKMVVVLDGNEGKYYDKIDKLSLTFSSDGNRFAYSASDRDRKFVVIDGKEGKKYDWVGNVQFSPDGNHFGYSAREGRDMFAVIDNVEGRRYKGVSRRIVFSDDSKNFAYVAWDVNNKEFVVLNNRELQRYDGVSPRSVCFNPKDVKICYFAYDEENDEWFPVVNGKEGKRYEKLGEDGFIFSPDGEHIAFVASKDGDHWFTVWDYKDGDPYDGIGKEGVIFSPDSKNLFFFAKEDDEWFPVINGKKLDGYDSWKDPLFSPDSSKFAFIGIRESEDDGKDYYSVVVVYPDGSFEEGEWYDNIYHLSFSPDGKYLAYTAKKGVGDYRIVVNGDDGERYYNIGDYVIFSKSNNFWYFRLDKNGNIYLVEEEISRGYMIEVIIRSVTNLASSVLEFSQNLDKEIQKIFGR